MRRPRAISQSELPSSCSPIEADSLDARHRMKFEENDPYLRTVRERWQEGLIQLVRDIPELDVLME